jgi:hypothetical protein
MWHRVDMVLTDVSEERIAVSNVSHGRFARRLSYNFPSTLKMEAILSSETSVNTISAWCHIPEDCFLQNALVLLPPGCDFIKYLSTESTADSINVGEMPTGE